MRNNDERLLRHEMSDMAAELSCDGYAGLRLDRATIRYMEKAGARIAHMAARTESEALSRLGDTVRIMESCARQTALEREIRLPARGRDTRIGLIMKKICSGGDRSLTLEGLLIALRSFDDVQGLTMAEYWAAPHALRIAICRAWARAADSLMKAANERIRAEEWVYSGGSGDIHERSSAFCERALQLAMELEKPELRARLEDALSRVDSSPAASVRHAHEAQALALLRIENLAAIKRMLDAADWQSAFEHISRTEMELREDPSRVYPDMTRSSRAAVRAQVAYIARRLKLGETTVARCAVNAAREFDRGDVRGGVCWWLYDDEGRQALTKRLGVRRPLRRMRPDPCGYGYMLAAAVITALAAVWAADTCGSLWALPATIPLAWHFVTFSLSQLITRRLKPRQVLRMDYECLPDDRRTLVVIPALITSAARAEALCAQLERLGCLETDPNLDFLLLGDFPDAAEHIVQGDGEITEAARRAIDRLNARAERRKYHYLHRTRMYAEKDGIYRGRARKRGALMALGRLMTGRGSDEFGAEGTCAGEIASRFRYAVTLDADTVMLPGAAREMVAAMAHPLNEYRAGGFGVMQPCVEIDPAAPASGFSRLFAGEGGLNTYSAMISDLFYDIAGVGSYCGKGVIDMSVFLDALDGRLDDDRILSHDLIEGMLARAGRINDVSVFDGFPTSYGKYIARQSRWTRGDWQLLPEIVRPDIALLDRYRLVSNLMESLWEPALFWLFVGSVWAFSRGGFAVAVAFALIEPIISRALGDKNAFRRGCVQLSALPAAAYARLDAIIRALYRMTISKRRMLEWVTSADAGDDMRTLSAMCRAAALLLLPGILAFNWTLPTAALAALFLVSPGWLRELGEEPVKNRGKLADDQREMLMRLGRDTWRFFERYVTPDTCFLPPDNVQLDPDVGPAPRTSPTNIAMYMLSCVCARRLGYTGDEELIRRLDETASTLERVEKWNGHLYNWYDIYTLEPLKPRYISAVDSGNLAAGLLLCAQAAKDNPVADRLRRLAEDMDFTVLYDKKRELFHIGADVEHARLSESHYDLLASESRILSYTAMMLGQISVENWRALGRPVSNGALISWSGTAFEYLMPSIFMTSAPGTLMDETLDEVIRVQEAFGRTRCRPWGVSESGYHAFDMNLNYQYRAFGMRELALGGRVLQNVVAPYASCLALMVRPADAAANIRRMLDLNWAGECGFFEAADYTRSEPGIVKSWMSHHQGMALCAICNALEDEALVKYFMEMPEARALELLLNERPAARIRLKRARDVQETIRPHVERRSVRNGRAGARLADTCVLGGAGATAIVTARGDVEYMRNGVWANRFTGDLLRRSDGIATTLRNAETGACVRINSADSKSGFEAGRATFTAAMGGVDAAMQICVSPQDGALVRLLRLENTTSAAVKLEILDAFETAMMTEGELRAHPAFFRLFCTADLRYENAIVYRRRRRSPGENHMSLFHVISGASCLRETAWSGYKSRAGELKWNFGGNDGPQPDPGSIICAPVEISPGEARTIAFTVGLCGEGDLAAALENYSDGEYVSRQLRLARTHGRSVAEFVGLDVEKRHLADRAAAFFIDPRLAPRPGTGQCPRPGGIPWDIQCACVLLDGNDALAVLRDLIKLHEYYRALGLYWQLAVIDESAGDYARPVRDAVDEMIGACHLRDLRFVRGGVSTYDGAALENGQREAILRSACLVFDGRSPLWAQLRRQLMNLEYVGSAGYGNMRPDSAPLEGGEGLTGSGYVISAGPDRLPPAPWCNIITGERLGMLISERGGGFIWHKNSRLRRVTNFDNDPMCEGWGVMLYVADSRRSLFARALPGETPMGSYRVTHELWGSTFETSMDNLTIKTAIFHDDARDALRFLVAVENRGRGERDIAVTAFADWLMGEDASDAARTRSWNRDGAIFASGGIEGVAYMACDGPGVECGPHRSAFLGKGGVMYPDGLMERRAGNGGCVLRSKKLLQPGEKFTACFSMGVEPDAGSALTAARALARSADAQAAMKAARDGWEAMREEFSLRTGDGTLDELINGFLVKQVLDGRVRARAGFYQAGGAYGFRDQLQDMLALLPWDSERVRSHIMSSAEHQFASGDVMHWWHEPYSGVRTRISDDMLFLPMVTARYVRYTGDAGVLDSSAEFLADVDIPDGCEDWYGQAQPSGETATLREHCMRAFRRAWKTGVHGLVLMGSGDWNDGMNRVGNEGRGESVWLTMFFACTADEFADILDGGPDARWLRDCAARARSAVEENGWDGGWLRRKRPVPHRPYITGLGGHRRYGQ